MPRRSPSRSVAPPNSRRFPAGADPRAVIIEAARRCFTRFGVDRTTMEDVAKECGIVRQHLYSFISGRSELVELVVLERCEELIREKLVPVINDAKSFEDGLLEFSIAAVGLARDDPELRNLYATTTTFQVHEVIAGPFPEIHQLVAKYVTPLLDRGRASGHLRPDATNDELVDWMRGVYLQLAIRQDLAPEDIRRLVKKFVLPSILAPEVHPSREFPVPKAVESQASYTGNGTRQRAAKSVDPAGTATTVSGPQPLRG